MTNNIFNREMTWLSRVTLKPEEQNGNNIKTMTIGEFIDPKIQAQFRPKIEAIRALCLTLDDKLRNKKQIAELKRELPAGIISGTAEGGIGEQNIVSRNNVVAVDIDAKDNPALYDWEAVKAVLGTSPYIAYAGLSVSGLGVWALISVADGMNHKQHFDAIAADFANTTFTVMQGQDTEPTILHGITIDRAPANIASKRFVSFDPHPYINTNAQIYTKTVKPLNLYDWHPSRVRKGKPFSVEDFLRDHNIPYNARERQGGIQYIVTCPWVELHSSHSRADSAIFICPDGRIGYKCMHAHCADKHWRDYRQYYDPEAYLHTPTP